MFDENVMDDMVHKLFEPAQLEQERELNKQNECKSNSDESLFSESFRNNKRGYASFDSVINENYTMYELDDDAKNFCRYIPKGSSLLSSFFLETLENNIRHFKIENTKLYHKLETTFYSLGLPYKFIPLVLFNSTLDLVPPLDTFLGDSSQNFPHRFFQKISNLNISDIIKFGAATSNFVNYGIIEEAGHGRFSSLKDIFQITDRFKEFILDDKAECFGMDLIKQDNDEVQPLPSFFLPDLEKNKILALLKSNQATKILLHGTPGTGKTEFARSVIREAGFQIQMVDSQDPYNSRNRNAALVLGDKVSTNSSNCLIFDEADDLLNESNGHGLFSFFGSSKSVPERKIWMNDFLDQSKGKVIFITNMSSAIHGSVLRRFDYNIEFLPSDTKQRQYYWNKVLELEGKKEIFTDNEIEELAEKFPIGVGGISLGIKASKKILISSADSDFKSTLQDVLSKHVQLIGGKIKKPTLSKSPYDSSFLNVDGDLEGLEHLVQEYKERMYSAEHFGQGSLCLLFYGKPGTGKTEYARYLSKKLDLELIQKRSSDLQSPYLGITEKNIARAFQEAETKKAIFFLDEADTFFRSRELATRSWEGSQTNEFLTWMESFQGIFIASTNFLKDFDQAALRRFAWKAEFLPLDRESKIKILASYFPITFPKFTQIQLENIKDISGLTPGDYKAVFIQFRYRDQNSIASIEIENALRKEASFKSENEKKIVGF